jgi:hypothetical protein
MAKSKSKRGARKGSKPQGSKRFPVAVMTEVCLDGCCPPKSRLVRL